MSKVNESSSSPTVVAPAMPTTRRELRRQLKNVVDEISTLEYERHGVVDAAITDLHNKQKKQKEVEKQAHLEANLLLEEIEKAKKRKTRLWEEIHEIERKEKEEEELRLKKKLQPKGKKRKSKA